MTKSREQAVFDTVVAHARQQRCVSTDKGSCLYRGPNGTKCFIGALIPDDLYSEALELRLAPDLPSEVLTHIGVDPAFL